MAQLFFREQGETKFIEISPDTHERLRLYCWEINLSLQQATNLIYERFGDISEELIIRYLDTLNQ